MKTLRSVMSMTLTIGLANSALASGAVVFIDLSLFEITLMVAAELFANATIIVCSRLMHAIVGYPAMIRVRLVVVVLRLVTVVGLHTLAPDYPERGCVVLDHVQRVRSGRWRSVYRPPGKRSPPSVRGEHGSNERCVRRASRRLQPPARRRQVRP